MSEEKSLKERQEEAVAASGDARADEFGKLETIQQALEIGFRQDPIKIHVRSSILLIRDPSIEDIVKILDVASLLEGVDDEHDPGVLKKSMNQLTELLADLSMDESLTEEFWRTKVPMASSLKVLLLILADFTKRQQEVQVDIETFRG